MGPVEKHSDGRPKALLRGLWNPWNIRRKDTGFGKVTSFEIVLIINGNRTAVGRMVGGAAFTLQPFTSPVHTPATRHPGFLWWIPKRSDSCRNTRQSISFGPALPPGASPLRSWWFAALRSQPCVPARYFLAAAGRDPMNLSSEPRRRIWLWPTSITYCARDLGCHLPALMGRGGGGQGDARFARACS